MKFDKTIDKLSASVPEPQAETEIGEDGLLKCKDCGGNLETIIEIFGEKKKVRCICKCQKEKMEAEERARENEERLEKIEKLRMAGFHDKELRNWTFYNDDGSQPQAIKAARNYVDNFKQFKEKGKGLLLYGNVGTGKTYVAAAIANALVDKGVPVLMTNFSRIANKLQESFEGRQAYLDNLNKFDLLVLDDLAAERKTEYMQEIVFTVIDERYRSGLPMIITTNLGLTALGSATDVMEARIYDRVMEKCFPIEVKGRSHRKKERSKEYAEMKELLGL